jgi:hypothetical protein
MTRVITAPDLIIPDEMPNRVFLAGAIDMGAAVDWQAWIIERLQGWENLTLLNPRHVEFTPDTLDEQINWELRALDSAHRIFLWFPVNAKAPISFFEAGLYWRSGKLIVGAEHGFYRRRNLELTARYYGTELWGTLDEMKRELVRSLLKI